MLFGEFTAIAGIDVSMELYETVIEPMYNATNLGKKEFCKLLNKDEIIKKDMDLFKKNTNKLVQVFNFFSQNAEMLKMVKGLETPSVKVGRSGKEFEILPNYRECMELEELKNFIINDLNEMACSRFGEKIFLLIADTIYIKQL